MRIIAGEFRRRLLESPPDDTVTRPIPDRVKESLFAILRGHCEGASVFDGFAGTGAIGLEAISRGASRCVLVERDRDIAQMLRRNVEALGVQDRCEVVAGDCLGPGALARCPRPLHLAFLDPPYPLVRERVGLRRVLAQLGALVELLDASGYAVLRTPWPLLLPPEGAEPEPQPQRETRASKRADRRSSPPRGPRSKGSRRPDINPDDPRDAHDDWADADADAQELTPDQIARAMSERPAASDSDAPDDPNDPRDPDFDSDALDESDQAKASSKPTLIAADLRLPNARGPETHVYHAMAIHFYMRKPPAP
jgi:16S rRNA (guanine(966)-N(2))-methyltransferase RsmD